MNVLRSRIPDWLLTIASVFTAGIIPFTSGRFRESPAQERVAPLVAPPLVPKSSPANEKVWRALDEPINVEFDEVPLRDAVRTIGVSHRITIRTDKDAIEGAQITLEQPVSLKIPGISLRVLLQLLLEPMQLDFFIDDGELVVTTQDKAAAHFSEVSYSLKLRLGDLPRAGIPLADLGEAITQFIEPKTWKKYGGQGSVVVEQDWFRIRQRADVHEDVEELLRDLLTAIGDPRLAADESRVV